MPTFQNGMSGQTTPTKATTYHRTILGSHLRTIDACALARRIAYISY